MAKKKKDIKKKKKILSLKLKKKKKKKEGQKKESKKKIKSKKKEAKKTVPTPENIEAPVVNKADHSSNYTVKEAIVKIRAIQSKKAVKAFVKAEQRVTITKIIPAVLNRLGA